jgi:DMSO/TMAO reductase YedYZ molybdopterin-dependent catalytic subunit
MATRGFTGRPPHAEEARRLPPGQSKTEGFPVLSMGPAPRVAQGTWSFSIVHGDQRLARWSWGEFERLPRTAWRGDIHCVTKWTKLDTEWEGVTIDDLFAAAGIVAPTKYLLAKSFDGYDTNVPLADLVGGRAMIAIRYAGQPLAVEHGGPARLLVPHLYFWKSAKWVNGVEFIERDEPGFWEKRGYHIYGDPWREQRYSGDP